MTLPAGVPAPAHARLPQSYEVAKKALADCTKMDECQEWANKAEALASYAKQADDDTLRKHADRIQARAVRRAQELLKQFPEGTGSNQYKGLEGAHQTTRRKAAEDAGMSRHQYRTAMALGEVPEQEFEEQIESDDPPTVTKLAEQGRQQLTPDAPKGFSEATKLIGSVKRFAEFCEQNDPDFVVSGVLDHERVNLKEKVSTIDSWLDRFVIQLESKT